MQAKYGRDMDVPRNASRVASMVMDGGGMDVPPE